MQRYRPELILCALLLVLVQVALHGVIANGFVNYDDPLYIMSNPHVSTGLTASNFAWACRNTDCATWHPLTWLSLQLDHTLFGPSAVGFHVTNLLFHSGSTVALFLLLRRLTGSRFRSAFVAALFAVHPLHVESVAWATERKDVLSTLLALLAMHAHVGYLERPGKARFGLVLLLFALALMAKPMVVTLPCVLLLLDYWPLRRLRLRGVAAEPKPEGSAGAPARFEFASFLALVWEKRALFALSAVVAAIQVLAQADDKQRPELLPWFGRLGYAILAYGVYIEKMLWPSSLCAHYPVHGLPPFVPVLGVALVLIALTVAAWRIVPRYGYLSVGWLWYAGTLFPVSGLFQIGHGDQAWADRYTYIPLIGLFLGAVWGVAELALRWRIAPRWVGAAGVVVLLACVLLTRAQVEHWRDAEALWEQALVVDPDNAHAQEMLGRLLLRKGDTERSEYLLGQTVASNPRSADLRNWYGFVLLQRGRDTEALQQFDKAVELSTGLAEAHNNRGRALANLERFADAAEAFRRASELQPANPAYHCDLAHMLRSLNRPEEAAREFALAQRLNPRWPFEFNQLAWRMATSAEEAKRRPRLAVWLAEELCEAPGGERPDFLDTLAAAYAAAGRFDRATAIARQALELARSSGNTAAVQTIRERLNLYESGQCYLAAAAPP